MTEVEEIYKNRLAGYSREISRLQKPLGFIAPVRLALFAAIGFLVYFYLKDHNLIFIGLAMLSFAGFIITGIYDSRLKSEIKRNRLLIRINEQELTALAGDTSAYDPGNEFLSQDHPYTFDLDVFGGQSLFQMVNRSATIFGSQRLADFFTNAYNYRKEIMERQQAVRELAADIEFRQTMQLIFAETMTEEKDLSGLAQWLDHEPEVSGKTPLRILIFGLPALTLIMISLSVAGVVPYQVAVFLVMLQMLIVFAFGRKTMMVHEAVTKRMKILEKYASAVNLTETAAFQSGFNRNLQDRLRHEHHGSPAKIIKNLTTLLNLMDTNLNVLVSVILNGLFMFNIHVVLAVENWRQRYRRLVPQWFAVLAEVDAMSSLGTFAFNHPGYCYPEPRSDDFIFKAVQVGHPLIPEERCVRNDVEIAGWNQFRIITGANMSGKSTFLRTIGLNYLLAMAGAPVFARAMEFTPVEIHSSIRTNDSLARRESYFYAELRRLREIIDELKSGRRVLILLDEILKGTNSLDKQTGSQALIRNLLNYQLVGLFATHDLSLGNLINEFPQHIQNLCFEISFKDDLMSIDYKLREGVCSNLNASFLMKQMGII